MQRHLSIFSLLAFTMACGPQPHSSKLQESIDGNSAISKTGYIGKLDYASLSESFEVEADQVGWADSYWPTVERGMAKRWRSLVDSETSPIGLIDFIKSHLEEDKKPEPSLWLSPAEKYDLLFRWRHGKALTEDSLAQFMKVTADKEASYVDLSDLAGRRQRFSEVGAELNRAEAFQELFPLSTGSWSSWLQRNANKGLRFLNEDDTGDDWSWEGVCHGWAPAALFEEAPKHAVRVKLGEQSLLMTEGDLRGLLSYAWADYSPWRDQYFIGRRCNEDVTRAESRGPVDLGGRNIYGTFKLDENAVEQKFNLVEELDLSLLRNNRLLSERLPDLNSVRYYEVKTAAQPEHQFILEMQFYRRDRGWYQRYSFAETRLGMDNYLKFGDDSGVQSLHSLKFYGCGDVNPAVLHTNIIQALKIDRLGFVMDRTQSGQVWNQPVYAAKVEVKDKIILDPELYRQYHHPEQNNFLQRFTKATHALVPVEVTLTWSAEPSRPSLQYSANFDRSMKEQTKLEYMLEFNEEDELVGGEWGTLGKVQPSQQIPDFMYGYKKGAKPYDAIAQGFDYSGIISKLHACSLEASTDGVYETEGRRIAYVDCELESLR